MKILLVDDDKGVRRSLARLLEALGHSVITAGTKEEAMSIFRAQPGLIHVITDLSIGHPLEGLEIVKEVVAERRCVRVCLMSGDISDETAREAYDLGVDFVLQKPITVAILHHQVLALWMKDLED